MNRLRFYFTTIHRHAKYGSKRQALGYALHHWRFWQGAEPSGEPYVHIGSETHE